MRTLKALVIVMGVLIVAGLAVVAITVANRAGAPTQRAQAPGAVALPLAGDGAALSVFGDVSIPLPEGFAPVEIVAEGDRMMVRLQGPDGQGRIVAVDLRTGRTLGTVTLEPEPARPAR